MDRDGDDVFASLATDFHKSHIFFILLFAAILYSIFFIPKKIMTYTLNYTLSYYINIYDNIFRFY